MHKAIITPETGAYSHKDWLGYDIESTYLTARIWRTGEQIIRHDQLFGKKYTDVICVTYCYGDDSPAESLDWGLKKQNSAPMIKKFDEMINRARVVMGKNSDRFDNKHLNTLRLLNNHAAMPEWTKKTEDLEKLVRNTFNLPSYTLDYISELLGLGGKIKMEMEDWVRVVELKEKDALDKMLKYGKKDVEDTRAIWNYVSAHVITRQRAPAESTTLPCCTHCGSANVYRNGTRRSGNDTYQNFRCNNHHGYAGKALITKKGYGKMSK